MKKIYKGSVVKVIVLSSDVIRMSDGNAGEDDSENWTAFY